ncbi:MAG TPA: hypothetical protein VK689_13575, partial [Armatimonadota bacterium]|nr:hypothetical protein [Armatimonadota bacterium]
LSTDGREVWSGTRPFAFWEAAVSEDGAVGGYAYPAGSHEWTAGEFRVVLLAPDGRVRLNQATPRQGSLYLHMPPDPRGEGVFVDGENDRFVVRVADPDVNRRAESWWVFRLSTGERLAQFQPKLLMTDTQPTHFVIDTRPVAGTPLTLLHWWRASWKPRPELGARFTLVDLEGKPVWQLELPADYHVPGNKAAEERLIEEIWTRGAILRTDRPRQFELRFVTAGQRVRFTARPAAGKWEVEEAAREAYLPGETSSVLPAVPERELASRGRLVLRSPGASAGPIRDIDRFVRAGRGQIAFLRQGGSEPAALVLVDPSGKTHEIALTSIPVSKETQWSGLAWLGGRRFLVTLSNYHPGGYDRAWSVDFRTRSVTAVPRFRCPSILRVAGFGDGSFAVLAWSTAPYTLERSLHVFDARGKECWRRDRRSNSTGPETLRSPEDLAVTTDGQVVVLDNRENTLQFFDRTGRYLRTVSLEQAWGRKPEHAAGLTADGKGGLIVRD